MNCKPGDIAVIVGFNPTNPGITGRIVDVIELAPAGVDFKLPSGKAHMPAPANCWIIRFQNAVDLSSHRGRPDSLYAVCRDRYLRPLRDPGEDAQDETLNWLPVPERDEVPA